MSRDRTLAIVLTLVLAGYLSLAGLLPPTDDEIYYWCWAKQLQLSYFDHPPLTAYLIRASIELFGDSVWAMRLPACLASVAVLGVLASLMRPLSLWYLLLFTPLFNLGGILITPDTPLLLCWAFYLLWMVRAHQQLERSTSLNPEDPSPGYIPLRMWLLGGLILGLGGLGKYTMILTVPAGAMAFVLSGRSWRTWLPGYVLHGLLAFILVIPVFVYNWQLDFTPLRFQWRHATCCESIGGLKTLTQFLGVQLLLVGWMPLILLPWSVRNYRSLISNAKLRVCFCLFALPFCFFLYQAFKKPLEGNWALGCYLGLWPIAAHWAAGWATTTARHWLTRLLFGIPAVSSCLLAVHLLYPLPLIKPNSDRITRQTEKWKLLREASEILEHQPEQLPVYTPLYQWTALLQFHGVPARQLDGISRPSHFTMPPHVLSESDRAYVFNEGPLFPQQTPGFGPPEVIANLPLVVRGELYTVYQVLRYTKLPTTGSPIQQ